ncbi:hypothetical protein V6N13_065899 [Hibiscus sabdariffa]|uniref:Uncharacterized protein n=1 Tax=Hibiscus sabdariffa TaxID=183260 RepID=A0ABR2BHZ9_9ROSI
MTVPSGNVVLSDKMPLSAHSAAGANGNGNAVTLGGGAGVFNQQHHQNWIPDERDGFIYWLRGEFATTNAMIDAICNHLRGDYEAFIACIQQLRCHWNCVLHMQQFFSITEISYTLHMRAIGTELAFNKQNSYFKSAKPIHLMFSKMASIKKITQKWVRVMPVRVITPINVL